MHTQHERMAYYPDDNVLIIESGWFYFESLHISPINHMNDTLNLVFNRLFIDATSITFNASTNS